MAKTPKEKKGTEPKFVTEERFAALENGVNDLVELMKSERAEREERARGIAAVASIGASAPLDVPKVVETPLDKEVRQAGPNRNIINPEWEEKARDIIGEAVDHCEMSYGTRGGIRFTVVIKHEYSNAPNDYLSRMGSDRRSRDIGGEGLEGVEAWCKLIKQNLSRTSGGIPQRTS